MQLKLYKINKDLQIFQKLKLFNKLKINQLKIQFNIMIFDIDQKNMIYKIMNILQLKWILYNQIQKNIFFKIIKLYHYIKLFNV